MAYLLAFKLVSITFTLAALVTGVQGVVSPVAFSRTFGLPLPTANTKNDANSKSPRGARASAPEMNLDKQRELARTYASLMGARQLGTGVILAIFIYQDKWVEVATVLAVIGFVYAGMDGLFLARAGKTAKALWHALPGALIATLALAAARDGRLNVHIP